MKNECMSSKTHFHYITKKQKILHINTKAFTKLAGKMKVIVEIFIIEGIST